MLKVSRSAYYLWTSGELSNREQNNLILAGIAEKIHTEDLAKGYRRIRDDLEKYHNISISDKKALRICRVKDNKSTIKYRSHGCTRRASSLQHIADNILNREFHADKPNEKWLNLSTMKA